MAFAQEYMVPTEFARKLERERDEWRNKFELSVDAVEIAARAARAESERDEARELAQQMSESNQVLLADVKYYRGEFERMRRSHE